MNKIMSVFFLVVVLALLPFFTGYAEAQNEAGSFSLTPYVGGYVFDDDQNLDNGPVLGAGIGYNYTKHIGVEGIINYIDTESDRTGSDVDGFIFRADGLYHFMPDEQLVPYVAAGLGAISINGDERSGNTSGMANYGAGIKYFISETLAIRADIRHILDFDGTNNNLAYTVGLSYLFGKKAPQAAPPPPPEDSDGDGVYDDRDRCPGTPSGVAVDRKGCPLDSDNDGVYDYRDDCPDTPAGAPVNSAGCPLDSDGDGVYDYLDKCPGTLPQIAVDDKGCPLPIKEKVSIELKVEFAFNSAAVKGIYDLHIEKVVNFLKTYPDVSVVVEGHTDSIGSEEYNLRLSQKRSENVMQYLVNYGIDSARLSAKGYGESKPIADNATEEGRQRNRRVIAVISTIVTR